MMFSELARESIIEKNYYLRDKIFTANLEIYVRSYEKFVFALCLKQLNSTDFYDQVQKFKYLQYYL